MKRIVSLLLILCLLPLAGLPAAAQTTDGSPFTDIPDEETRQAAALLYHLGIVTGTGGTNYSPGRLFDRSMLAVIGTRLSGVFDVSGYGATVRFSDVRASHWAHRWINAATSPLNGNPPFMVGLSDGRFHPDGHMLYGQLITVLMRLLGYTDADVGFNWPHSYIARAEALGISEGMSFRPNQALTRGQAARLIYNFLFIPRKGGDRPYVESIFDVTVTQSVYQGRLARLLTDKAGNVLSVKHDHTVTYREVVVAKALTRGLELPNGTHIPITPGVTVWTQDGTGGGYDPASFLDMEPVTLIMRNNTLLHILRHTNIEEDPETAESVLFFDVVGDVTVISHRGSSYIYNGVLDASFKGRLASIMFDRDNNIAQVRLDQTVTYRRVTVSEGQSRVLVLSDGSRIPAASAVSVWNPYGVMSGYDTGVGASLKGEQVTLIMRGNTLLHILRETAGEMSGEGEPITNFILRIQTIGNTTVVADANGNIFPVRAGSPINPAHRWQTGTLFVDGAGNAAGFTPANGFTYRTVTVADAFPNGFVNGEGAFTHIPASASVWSEKTNDFGFISADALPYSEAWPDLRAGDTLFLAYNMAGRLLYIYHASAIDPGAYQLAVIEAPPAQGVNPLVTAFGAGAAGATLYKNGHLATLDMLERWDVLMFYESAGVVEASSVRFSGHFRTIAFSSDRITVQDLPFPILPEAMAKIGTDASGSRVFFFAHDGRIADVRNSAPTTTIGLAQPGSVLIGAADMKIPGTMTGPRPLMTGRIGSLQGMSNGTIRLTPFEGVSGRWGELNLTAQRLGTAPIAPWCVFYDQAGADGRAVRVTRGDIPASLIPAGRILFAEIGPGGYVTAIVMNNVTGDAYNYGFAHIFQNIDESWPGSPVIFTTIGLSYVNDRAQTGERFLANGVTLPREGAVVGITVTNGHTDGIFSEFVTAVQHTGLTRHDFNGTQSVKVSGRDIPIAAGLEVHIPGTEEPMSIDKARAFCRTFEVFTDPNGYKVRLIIGRP
jgi:hypothetical protein